MRFLLIMAVSVAATSASAQIIDGNGVRANGVVIDGRGVHTADTSIDAGGVHRRGSGVSILTNGGRRAVDCRGGALSVAGNANDLTVRNCRSVSVMGNRNTLRVFASPGSNISVPGNRNSVTYRPAGNSRVGVSVTGNANSVTRG